MRMNGVYYNLITLGVKNKHITITTEQNQYLFNRGHYFMIN